MVRGGCGVLLTLLYMFFYFVVCFKSLQLCVSVISLIDNQVLLTRGVRLPKRCINSNLSKHWPYSGKEFQLKLLVQ